MGSNYDEYLDAADAERWRRKDEGGEPRAEVVCFDCGDLAVVGFTSVPVEGGRRYCGPCAKFRSARGWLFDVRRRDVLDQSW